jgi:hypothetical protein
MSACLISNSRDAAFQNRPKASELRLQVTGNQIVIETNFDQRLRGITWIEWPLVSRTYDFYRAFKCF